MKEVTATRIYDYNEQQPVASMSGAKVEAKSIKRYLARSKDSPSERLRRVI